MLKKVLFGMLAFASLFATSCSNELEQIESGNTSSVSFKVMTPAMESRAYSDGTTASVLQYAVYDAEGNYLPNLTKTDGTINGSTTVNLQLTTGNTYSVIFWAAAEGAPYAVDFENKKMTVDYTADKTKSNDEKRDAFYKYHTFTVNGAQTETVELKRPFAQLNIGTADFAASTSAGYTPTESAVTVKNIYKTLDLVGGMVSDAQEVAFGSAAIPAKYDATANTGEKFPVDNYDYLAMNYLLVGADQETIEVEYTYTDGTDAKTRTVGSVPVRRNYRTNIYGNLLTSEVDVKVEIKPGYDDAFAIYNVVVDGVSYDDFATAVAKAMELNKPVEFIQNVKIDADEKIEVPAGKTLTLNLNGYTLSGVTDQTSNREMFLVKGTLNVNGANTLAGRAAAEGNGIISIRHDGTNMEWNAMTTIFDVTDGGVLNIKNTNAINFGGSDMGFVAHLNNWGEVTLNVENSTLESNYVAVRVFNSGPNQNNVTIKNSTLKGGSNAFWVQNYTTADFGGKLYSGSSEAYDQAKVVGRLKFDVFNGTNEFVGKNDTPIRYGMTNAIYADKFGLFKVTDAEGNVVEGIGMDIEGNYSVTAASGLEWVSANISENSGFEGKTIKLANDIDLSDVLDEGESFTAIGEWNNGFKGTFDGQNHTIKKMFIQTNMSESVYGYFALFGCVDGGEVKNLKMEDFECVNYGGYVSAIAATSNGDCLFENIELKSGVISAYNRGTAPIVSWAGNGTNTYRNITIGEDVTVDGLWSSWDCGLGGVVGNLSESSGANFENVTVSCKLDAYNDVTSSYKWYAYRYSGMLIGMISKTQKIGDTNYPDPNSCNVKCTNVTVNYGDWMNYHYCEGYGQRKWQRVEAGYSSSGLQEGHAHEDGQQHNVCLPFDQLFGGGQGVYGLREYDGVTINYPASYRREVSTATGLKEALEKGLSVVLGSDVDYGTNKLKIEGENQIVDLGGHTLKTQMSYGGIDLKNGASIVNGVIEHTSTVAAIKAFNVGSIENVTIKATCGTADKTITAIAIQQGGHVGSIKHVTIEGVSQGIEVGYQATVDLIENVTVEEHTNGTANGIGLVINGGKVGKAKNCTFKGDAYGVTMHLKGVFAVGLELENCKIEGTTASIYAWDEKGTSNTSGSLNLTYDAATTLTGPFVWDFEDECKSVVTLNKP